MIIPHKIIKYFLLFIRSLDLVFYFSANIYIPIKLNQTRIAYINIYYVEICLFI